MKDRWPPAGCGLAPGFLGRIARGPARIGWLLALACGPSLTLWAQTNNLPAPEFTSPSLGLSLLRLFGALFCVIALFLGATWFFRNWQGMARRGRPMHLHILEMKSLGQRQALLVVGYQRQRFLVGSSPAGLRLVSPLPEAESQAAPPEGPAGFGEVLQQALSPKKSS